MNIYSDKYPIFTKIFNMDLLYLLIGLLLGLFFAFLFYNQKLKSLKSGFDATKEKASFEAMEDKTKLENQQAILNERYQHLLMDKETLEKKWQLSESEKQTSQNQLIILQSDYKHLQEKLETERKELEKLQDKFKLEFENIANLILKQNTREFNETSHKNMSDLLNPLKEKIVTFEKKVEDTYQKGLRDQTDLKAELKKLQDMNIKLGEEAGNLTRALKSDSKKQGNWGEVVLERILERSGLIKDEEYFLQYTATGENGKTFRPDVLIKLPEEKHLVIDSKVSLTAFQKYIVADKETEKQMYLKQHLLSIKNHVKELSEKSYDNLKGLNTPDFVLMFMPVEPAFGVAVQSDPEIFNYAWEKRIVIVSPTTLLATLLTVSSIWRHERQTQNALEIASQGGKLYDKFEGFLKDLERVGINLEKARESYQEAHKKLSSGRGNLVGQVEKLKVLGAKATKSIDQKYLED